MIKRLTTESSVNLRSKIKRSAMSTQSARIDNAMLEFHSVKELVKILELSEARIISHKRHLIKEFSHTCRIVEHTTNKNQFKFEVLI
jgi:hypothetical protein